MPAAGVPTLASPECRPAALLRAHWRRDKAGRGRSCWTSRPSGLSLADRCCHSAGRRYNWSWRFSMADSSRNQIGGPTKSSPPRQAGWRGLQGLRSGPRPTVAIKKMAASIVTRTSSPALLRRGRAVARLNHATLSRSTSWKKRRRHLHRHGDARRRLPLADHEHESSLTRDNAGHAALEGGRRLDYATSAGIVHRDISRRHPADTMGGVEAS